MLASAHSQKGIWHPHAPTEALGVADRATLLVERGLRETCMHAHPASHPRHRSEATWASYRPGRLNRTPTSSRALAVRLRGPGPHRGLGETCPRTHMATHPQRQSAGPLQASGRPARARAPIRTPIVGNRGRGPHTGLRETCPHTRLETRPQRRSAGHLQASGNLPALVSRFSPPLSVFGDPGHTRASGRPARARARKRAKHSPSGKPCAACMPPPDLPAHASGSARSNGMPHVGLRETCPGDLPVHAPGSVPPPTVRD